MDMYFDLYFVTPALYAMVSRFHPESLLSLGLAHHGLTEAQPGQPQTALQRFEMIWDLVRVDLRPFKPDYVLPAEDQGPTNF
jgi:hypothetical protein